MGRLWRGYCWGWWQRWSWLLWAVSIMFEQDRVIFRLQQHVMRERDILVCFLAGSFGRNTQDAYSDLDVALVFADEARRDAAYAKRREFVKAVLPYVPAKSFDATHVRPYFHIALYGKRAPCRIMSIRSRSTSRIPWNANTWRSCWIKASEHRPAMPCHCNGRKKAVAGTVAPGNFVGDRCS